MKVVDGDIVGRLVKRPLDTSRLRRYAPGHFKPQAVAPMFRSSGTLTGRVAVLVCTLCVVTFEAQGPLNLQSLDLDAIDRTCKPCDDFYQFAIGKWNADHPIPANQVRWGKRWAGADGNVELLRNVAEDAARRRDTGAGDERLIGTF